MSKNQIVISAAGVVILAVAVLLYFLLRSDLSGSIVIPYISHQKPAVDPHLPSSNDLADKLDEVQFDGLFNISANPSGIVYEDGLGHLVGIDEKSIVTVQLNTSKKWHSSYEAKIVDDELEITEAEPSYFNADDLRFTLRRIQALGSLSPDYILVSQAMKTLDFEGPDSENMIRFKFKGDRIWSEVDIKEVLSFKVLQNKSEMNALNYTNGTSSYLTYSMENGVPNYRRTPEGVAHIPSVMLAPFIDNSTFTTELDNNNINVLLSAPFGALSPIVNDPDDYFYKSSISTTFFALLFNTEKLNREKRIALRRLIDSQVILNRFYKVGTEQQKQIVDYLGNKNNYNDYLNNSVFPSSTYYVEEQIVIPQKDNSKPDLSVLSDTVRIQACVNYGYREEYSELIEILNDPSLFNGKLKVTAVTNEELGKGNYDAVLMAFSGYRSNFLFDLYDIFLREPNLEVHKINLTTNNDGTINPSSFSSNKNYFRLDPNKNSIEREDILQLMEYIYGFMSTKEIGDKQAYAERIDKLENEMALGKWLFSIPSLAYFSTQFDPNTIDLYGVAAQLSTIEKWEEKKDN
ncbi:MAG: hypothetical protein K9J16_15075 [Melioribacteraceae bacterium]|nr:hypothetical protein [Melioribacteraceae bacterium]MCF8355923.1 hypothetical protein [Melioribacteraceae bacterium]MCF8395463.1 hypothetical protein [Melioribacteraceae bacterium]MCF8420783.1 hypothetical protein [Melioribacteraceae bacterium]